MSRSFAVLVLSWLITVRALAEDAPPPVRLMADLKESLKSIHLNPDGTQAAVVTDKGKLRLWNVKESTELPIGEAPDGDIHRAEFSADGKSLLFSMSNGEVTVWDAVGKKPRWKRSGGESRSSPLSNRVTGTYSRLRSQTEKLRSGKRLMARWFLSRSRKRCRSA